MDIFNTLKQMKKADEISEEIKNTKPSKLTDKQKYLRSLRGRF